MYRKQRATVLVDGSGSSVPTAGRDEHGTFHDNNLTPFVPRVGPLNSAPRPKLALWPSTQPSPNSPTSFLPKLQQDLQSFVKEQQVLLDRSVDPDYETQVVIHFQLLDECCRRFSTHFPAYRNIYQSMRQSVQTLNTLFDTINVSRDETTRLNETLRSSIGQRTLRDLAQIAQLQEKCDELSKTHLLALQSDESLRVVKTENVELFEQSKKLKKKVSDQADLITSMTSKILLLTVNQTRLENEVQKLQHSLAVMHSERDKVAEELDAQRTTCSNLSSTNEEQQKKITDYESVLVNLQSEAKRSSELQNELNGTIRRLQAQLAAATVVHVPAVPKVLSREHSELGSPKLSNGRRTPRPNWGQMEDEGSEGYGLQFEGNMSTQARVEIMWKKIVSQHEQLKSTETDLEQLRAVRSMSIEVPSSADTEGIGKEGMKVARLVTSIIKVDAATEMALLDCTQRDLQRMIDLLYQHFFRSVFDARSHDISFKYLVNDKAAAVFGAVQSCKIPSTDVAWYSLLFWCLEWESTSPQLKLFLMLYSGQLPIAFMRWMNEDHAVLRKTCTSMDSLQTGLLSVKDFVDAVATTWPSFSSTDLETIRSFCKQSDSDVVDYASLHRWHPVWQCLTTFLVNNYFDNITFLESVLSSFGKESVSLVDVAAAILRIDKDNDDSTIQRFLCLCAGIPFGPHYSHAANRLVAVVDIQSKLREHYYRRETPAGTRSPIPLVNIGCTLERKEGASKKELLRAITYAFCLQQDRRKSFRKK